MRQISADLLTRQKEHTNRVLARLRALHAESTNEKSDAERISEDMMRQIIGETTLLAQHALVAKEAQAILTSATEDGWSEEKLTRALSAMRQRIATDMFGDHWRESTLSTPDHPIYAATYGTSMFNYDLRILMQDAPTVESFDCYAWIKFDVDGLRSFKDCTSHEDTTNFLRCIVKILVDENGPTHRLLREKGITAIPMATGGDEFELYLKGSAPLSEELLDEIINSFRTEVSTSKELIAFLDFDNEHTLIKYGMPSTAERAAFAEMTPEEKRERLAEIRASLPETFVPSMAGGGALLSEGLLLAVEKDEHDLNGDEDFKSLRDKLTQATIELAEERQKVKKETDMDALAKSDPKRLEWRLRNKENRNLYRQKKRLEAELAEAREELRRVVSETKES